MTSEGTYEMLLLAVRRVLRSLARLLMKLGIRSEEFIEVIKSVYIESAIRDFDHSGVPSRARIALLTGLTRNQINCYIDESSQPRAGDTALMFVVVEVLRTWHTNPRYIGPYGIPLELKFDAADDRCFKKLVNLVDSDIDPSMVLDELIKTGAVIRSGQEHFRALSRSVVLTEGMSPQRIVYHANVLTRLAYTLEYNMNPAHPQRRLERRVLADRGLPEKLVPSFEKYSRDKAMQFLLDLDNWLATQVIDESYTGPRVDVGVNVFFFVEAVAKAEALSDLARG